ncbi:ABC transporter ATP-binding protein [Pararhodospirillum oryzae]|uniref:ABC transporter n=1 Tax=Pararhodospirillum oryzae TaxID=478448 RepID=A0A512HA44_9PROT|nr:ATP-binding cassette domain-containing protein [Pararhodospirillum oryzae]GEO82302.1 ABC transporter [Pararhodospirillum oryzae]
MSEEPLSEDADGIKREKAVVVEAQALDYAYGTGPQRRQVLSDINLVVREGDVVLLTGPSGSGKTTLLTLIGTLRHIQEGQLSLFGKDVSKTTTKELLRLRNRVRFVFQRHNLLGSLNVLQNVISGIMVTPLSDPEWDEQRAVALLDTLGLGEKVKSWPDQLSGGQQQRVAIARALVSLPDLILADEPTASLDRESGRIALEQMRALANRINCAVVISSHDERIFDIATRRVHIDDGHLRELETTGTNPS